MIHLGALFVAFEHVARSKRPREMGQFHIPWKLKRACPINCRLMRDITDRPRCQHTLVMDSPRARPAAYQRAHSSYRSRLRGTAVLSATGQVVLSVMG